MSVRVGTSGGAPISAGLACLLSILFGLIASTALAQNEPVRPSQAAEFATVLRFDLTNDIKPMATVTVNRAPARAPDVVDLALIFPSQAAGANERGWFRTGHFDSWTLISYGGRGTNWPQQISVRPTLVRSDDPSIFENSRDEGPYLVVQGQQRRFYYRLPTDERLETLRRGSSTSPLTTPEVVEIILPEEAEDRSVVKGRLTIPDSLNRDERLFMGRSAENEEFIRLAYELPPTPFQRMAVTGLLSLLPSSILFVLLAFIPKADIKRKKLWIAAIVVGCLTSLALAAVAAVSMIQTQDYSQLPVLIGSVLGLIATGITWAVKK